MTMNDTYPYIDKKLTELYSKLSPEERFNKMLSMCQTVREIIMSQFPEGLSDIEKRKNYLRYFTGRIFRKKNLRRCLRNFFRMSPDILIP